MSDPTQAEHASPTVAYPVTSADGDNRQGQQKPKPLPAGKTPVGPGIVTAVGLTLAVMVVALGVVGVHDALVAAGATGGAPWIDSAVQPFNEVTPAVWLVPVSLSLVLLGTWLLLTAVRPRPRKAIALRCQTGVFLRPRDVAKLARNAAQEVDGVTSARVTAGPRKVTVAVQATTTEGVRTKVTQAVATRLGALATAPTVRVTVKTEGSSS